MFHVYFTALVDSIQLSEELIAVISIVGACLDSRIVPTTKW